MVGQFVKHDHEVRTWQNNVSLLTVVFGVEYFVLFFTLEYSGYLISPAHKCLPIGQKYFHTGFFTYLKALIIWIGLMITYGVLTII